MQLNETLQICLLALANRYPDHVVDINEALLGTQRFGSEGWIAQDLIEMLQHTHPTLLHQQAQIIIDSQKSEIFLPEFSIQQPALLIHCRGKLPISKGNVEMRLHAGVAATVATVR